jgi:hypothetical protein
MLALAHLAYFQFSLKIPVALIEISFMWQGKISVNQLVLRLNFIFYRYMFGEPG